MVYGFVDTKPMRSHNHVPILACLLVASGPAGIVAADAPTNIDPDRRFCWSENAGWIAFRHAAPVQEGARVQRHILRGFAWGENLGWINLGDGEPANGTNYANVDGGDFGVNVETARTGPNAGVLYGFAWSENAGWINFGERNSAWVPFEQRARIERPTNRLRGYAWSENLGWINLGEDGSAGGSPYPIVFTSLCPADFDNSGWVSADDIFSFLDAWFARSTGFGSGAVPMNAPSADIDGDDQFTELDIHAFLNDWFGSIGTICE